MKPEADLRCIVVGMLEGNCYLLRCGDKGQGVIIDPGDEPDKILAAVKGMHLEPEAILLTHGHIDHTNAAGEVRKRLRCRVVCHGLDSHMVRGEETPFWGLKRNPCEVDQEVADGDEIAVGDRILKVIHAPGHTPGSICFMANARLFSGDLLFMGSIGRTDLPGGSDVEMIKSLKTRIAVLDDETRVYPGHGPHTTIGREKGSNPFLRF
jgi:hydroxyacylglutathione hydrolase